MNINTNRTSSNRNYSIDVLKCICALLVVLLHIPSEWTNYYMPLTRIAVPCFFMISGYCIKGNDIKGKITRSVSRLLWLILWSSALYIFASFILKHFSIQLIIPSVKDLFNFLVFNENPWAPHLWYLNAYLYVLLIVVVIEKRGLWNIAYILIPLLLIVDLAFGKYSLLLWNKEFDWLYVRNFLFVGLPYFLIGAFVRSKRNIFLNKHILMGGVIIFSTTSFLERYLLTQIGTNAVREHYLSTTFLAVSVFLLALSIKIKKPNVLSNIGERDSLYIYIFHIVVASVLSIVVMRCPSVIGYAYTYMAPMVVFIITIAFVMILKKIGVVKC